MYSSADGEARVDESRCLTALAGKSLERAFRCAESLSAFLLLACLTIIRSSDGRWIEISKTVVVGFLVKM